MIKVFGHIAPDTDATGSAILMSWYLNNFTSQKAEAFVLGQLNKETQFVLNKWGIKEPELLEKIEKGDFRFDSSDDTYCGYCEIGFMCNRNLFKGLKK